MNIRLAAKQFGFVLIVLSVCMIACELAVWLPGARDAVHATTEAAATAQSSETYARWALLIAAVGGIVLGGSLFGLLRDVSDTVGRREALLVVGVSWLFGAALAGSPYMIWAHLSGDGAIDHPFRQAINCYFEAMSGLTTTGATVLSEIETLPSSLLFWRSLTHWLGGLGIVLLFVAILPSIGVGGKRLFRVEAPGPEPEGVHPHIRETARILWFIYLGLTVTQVLALKLIGGMTVFDSFCHTFGTLATGGFSTKNASVGHYYDSMAIDVIIIVFMVLAGANFGLYFQLIRKRWRDVLKDVELRTYVVILLVASAIVTGALIMDQDPIAITTGQEVESSVGESIRQGVFTTVAIQTTTGFGASDFNRWPFIAQGTLILLMFIGGCAGSTGGGIKVIRVWVAFRVMVGELERAFRPNVVRPIKVGGHKVDPDLKLGTLAYVLGVIMLFVMGSGAIMMLEHVFSEGCDFTSAATSSIATLCTIGPGLSKVGAIENYGWFCAGSKAVLCVLMALGRLEVFAILVLLTPRFWRGD